MAAVDLEKVLDRLATILEIERGSKPYEKDIAEALGLSPSALSNMKKRGRVPYEEISLFAASKQISINWLLFGQNPRRVSDMMEDTYRVVPIVFRESTNASAGGGAWNEDEDETGTLLLDERSLEALGVLGLKNVEAIRVVGDSMEPLIREDAIVLIDRDRTEIHGGGIFAVNVFGQVFIKRVRLNTKNRVELISENPAYPPSEEDAKNVLVIGKIVGMLERL